MILFSVAVAGFNKENRACELRLWPPGCADCSLGRSGRRVKARLDALNREYRDGLLSDQPLSGALE